MPKTVYVKGVLMASIDDETGPSFKLITPSIWAQTCDTARLAVLRGGAATASAAPDDSWAMSGQLEWHPVHSYGTDLVTLLTPDLVEFHYEYLWREKVNVKKLTGTTENSNRSRRRRLGKVLNAIAWPPAPHSGARAALLPPCSGGGMRLLLQQASMQKTQRLSDAMTGIMCLALGAGLTVGEMMRCTEDDLDWDADDRLLVHVRGDDRAKTPVTLHTVPVVTALGIASRLEGVASRTDASGLLIGPMDDVHHDPFGKIVQRFPIRHRSRRNHRRPGRPVDGPHRRRIDRKRSRPFGPGLTHQVIHRRWLERGQNGSRHELCA